MTKLKYWNVEPEEPSLSSDTRSMLHDEHSKRLDVIEARVLALEQLLKDYGVLGQKQNARVLALEQWAHRIDIKQEPLPWEDLD